MLKPLREYMLEEQSVAETPEAGQEQGNREAAPMMEVAAEPPTEVLPEEPADEALSALESLTPAPETAPPPSETPALTSPPQRKEPSAPERAESQAVEAPQAAIPAASTEKEEAKDRYWASVLTGDPDTVPEAVRYKALGDTASQEPEEDDYDLMACINRSWLVDSTGIPPDWALSRWGRLRSAMAESLNVSDDERELFCALSLRREEEPQRGEAREIYEENFRAALLGKIRSPEPWNAAAPETLSAEARLRSLAIRDGEARREKYLGLAQRVVHAWLGLDALGRQVLPAVQLAESSPDLWAACGELSDLPEEERNVVYHLAKGLAKEGESKDEEGEALFFRSRRAMQRASTNIGLNLMRSVGYAAVAGLGNSGRLLEGLGADKVGPALQSGADSMDRRMRIFKELKDIEQTELHPIYLKNELSKAEELYLDALSGIPSAVMAYSGAPGFATLCLDGVGEAMAEARARAPENSINLQLAAGMLGAGIQAGIYSGMSRIGGHLLAQSISSLARASGQGAKGYVWAGLKSLAAVSGENAKLLLAAKAGQTASLGLQELAARVEARASHIDWSDYGSALADLELNMREAAMNLPFILLGSGRVALRHFRSRRQVLGEDGQRLLDWGVMKDKVEEIWNEEDPNRQSELLRDALRSCRRWSGPNFLLSAARSLRLLNTEYFQGFKDPEILRDFMNLPAASDELKRPALTLRDPSRPEDAQDLMELYGKDYPNGSRRRLGIALALHDEWLQKSHINSPAFARRGQKEISPEQARESRMDAYSDEALSRVEALPEALGRGYYDPLADHRRDLLLRDRCAEVKDLSYQFLLNAFTVDSLMHNGSSFSQLRGSCEKTRLGLLGELAKSVLRCVSGEDSRESFRLLGTYLSDYYRRRRYRNHSSQWLRNSRLSDLEMMGDDCLFSSRFPADEYPPELQESIRVSMGLRSNAETLYRLLPCTRDFQTAISRGMTPLQAYSHILERELGFDASSICAYPAAARFDGGDEEALAAYSRQNAARFARYSSLFPCEPESCEGADGRTYWRVLRPNGQYTRWHDSREHAVNDMVSNCMLTFLPLASSPLSLPAEGGGLFAERQEQGMHSSFSGFDQLCGLATRDLGRYCMENVLTLQPGMRVEDCRRYFWGKRLADAGTALLEPGLGYTHWKNYRFDSLSMASPLSILHGRLQLYWMRQLQSPFLSSEEMGNYLIGHNLLNPERQKILQNILQGRLRLPPDAVDEPKKRELRYRRCRFDALSELARSLAGQGVDYLLNHWPEKTLPSSARAWMHSAALYEENAHSLGDGSKARGKNYRLGLGKKRENLLRWSNRYAALNLQAKAEELQAQRESGRWEKDNFFLGHLRRALGMDPVQRLEQAWCYDYAGGDALVASGPQYWALLREPVQSWKYMTDDEKKLLHFHLEKKTALPDSSSAELPPEADGEELSPDRKALPLALENLQAVLKDYPKLREYGLWHGSGSLLSRIRLKSPRPDDARLAETAPAYLSDWTRRDYETPYERNAEEGLPPEMSADPRVLPALETLGRLRAIAADTPYYCDRGILWRGQRYGGNKGAYLPHMEKAKWYPCRPLGAVFQLLDELNKQGGELDCCGVKLSGLDAKRYRKESLRHVYLYRHVADARVSCRLMPPYPENGNPVFQLPYALESMRGVYLAGRHTVKDESEMLSICRPMHRFCPRYDKFYIEEHASEWRRINTEFAFDRLREYADAMRAGERSPVLELPLRELLMRLFEDSGFSRRLEGKNVQELTMDQITGLKLAKNMILMLSPENPPSARKDFLALMKRLASRKRLHYGLIDILSNSEQGRIRKPKVVKPKVRRQTQAEMYAMPLYDQNREKYELHRREKTKEELDNWERNKKAAALRSQWYHMEDEIRKAKNDKGKGK